MSSFSGAIERWSIADLRHPVNSDDYTTRISPAKSIATAVDSAYSSFSGSSYVTDYQTAFQSDNYHPSDDQHSYMDSDYVKAVYNPSAVNNRPFINDPCLDDGTYNSEALLRTGNISQYRAKSHGSPDECHAPQKKLDCGSTIKDIEQVTENGNSDNPLSQKVRPSPPHNVSHFSSEQKLSRHQCRSPNWVKDSPGSQERISLTNSENVENHYFTRLSINPQSDNVPIMKESFIQNALSSNLAEEINCTYDNKQFPRINKLDKDYFKQMDLELEGISSNIGTKVGCIKQSEFLSGSDTNLKSVTNSSNEMSARLGVYDNKSGCQFSKPGKENHFYYSSKRTMSNEIIDASQNKPLSQNIVNTDHENHEQGDIRHKCPETKSGQIFYQNPIENLNVRSINPENGTNGAKIHHKDATIKPIPMLSLQLENDKTENNFSDLNSGKITKEATPMLYHLSGGRSNTFTSNPMKNPEQNLEPKAFKKMENLPTAQVTDVQTNIRPLQKNKSHSQLLELTNDISKDDGNTGSLTSSTEESFMHDYREKLKVAQKKVLRETSFKRKDLQMSLPGRLKINPCKRPSIDHLRSYSLSSANNETKFDQPKASVDTNHKKTDAEKSNISRIGGRKRITKEQRKLCYSEPEKLDHLGVQNCGFAWKEESPLLTQRKSSSPDMTSLKVRSLDSKERTVSTSNLSKGELKQIQQNALMQYMERKTHQRLGSSSQSNLQRTSDMKRYERKSMPNPSESHSQAYLHRRSTGASSSYDATVTWSDRFHKTSPFKDGQQTEPRVEDKCMTYLDQHTTEEDKHFEDCPPPFCQKSKFTHAGQVSNGCRASSTSPFFNTPEFNSRLSVSEDCVFSESDRVNSARGRGKSMDEIGTTDIVKFSVLSQSSDQLYHIKEPLNIPGTENASKTSVVHQEKLGVSTENALGNVPNQTSKEDFVRPRRSDVARSAWDRHSRPSRASAVSSTTETCISQVPYSRALEKSTSLETEDEVFSQAIAIRKELSSRVSFVHQEDCRRPLSNCSQEPSSITDVSDHPPLEHQTVTGTATSSEFHEKDLPENSNEVRDDTSDLLESQAFKRLSDPTEDREETKSEESKSMSNSQQEELILLPLSQVNALKTSQSPVGHNEHEEDNDTVGVESKASVLKSGDPGGSEAFLRVDVKPPEDDRHAELVKEIIAEDKSLADVLKPLPVRESAMELMKSLFLLDMSEMEKCRRRGRLKKDSNEILLSNSELESSSKLSSKAMLLLQKTSGLSGGEHQDGITAKKVELISCIRSKLEELCEQREMLLSDISDNLVAGKNMEAVVKEICKPNEYERYMMFIGDLEKVVSLLFCLSMRLARVENALSKIDDNTDVEEMQSLKERHNLLSRQREDAKDLKENLDRRERVVTGILAKYLSENLIQDYKHFVRLKTSFLIEQKDLDEKIKFHEEQLETLHNSIPP